MATTPLVRARRLVIVGLAGLLVGIGLYALVTTITTPRRTTPFYEPPVLAGQPIPGYCSGGVYARLGDVIVLTSSGHCGGEGTVVAGQGVTGPIAQDATCPYAGHTCHSSDMNYLVVADDRVPWGHLDQIDMGIGGYRTIAAGSSALRCDEIAVGDPVELNGRNGYRTGTVTEKGENRQDPAQDGSYFPCMVKTSAAVGSLDSGGVVLVRGVPAGVASRTFGGYLGFTPLAEGLTDLGLELCTDPDCGLVRPAGG